jgi:hypothetical protein
MFMGVCIGIQIKFKNSGVLGRWREVCIYEKEYPRDRLQPLSLLPANSTSGAPG